MFYFAVIFALLTRLSLPQAVCFPDDGAAKRFGSQFKSLGFEIIICGKVISSRDYFDVVSLCLKRIELY